MHHHYFAHVCTKVHMKGFKMSGKHVGIMVAMLEDRLSGHVQGLARMVMVCSWARCFTLTVPFSTQEYKWVPANCQGNLMKCWGVTCDGLASHPSNVPSHFMLKKQVLVV